MCVSLHPGTRDGIIGVLSPSKSVDGGQLIVSHGDRCQIVV